MLLLLFDQYLLFNSNSRALYYYCIYIYKEREFTPIEHTRGKKYISFASINVVRIYSTVDTYIYYIERVRGMYHMK